ncbi:MAG: hypothetical protein KDD92_19850 [Caldilineaceae bacterium]|nr:hypothetical protein [Caldilineaceae bacterium]
MSWQKYSMVFRLESPLHIGYRKVGNLMQTRGYVPGKNLWAVLTARLTRDYDDGAKGQRYKAIGDLVQEHFRFPYLYPAMPDDNGYKVHYPWQEDFDYLFLNSYASAALDYARQAAEDGLLHETEFIAPYTRTGRPVFLIGDFYVQTDLPASLDNWLDALKKFQIGAERSYGWGRMQLVSHTKQDEPSTSAPRATTCNGRITAHLKAEQNMTGIAGPVEPLIGWERNNDMGGNSRWRLSRQAIICYAPGSMIDEDRDFIIGADGRWE